MRRLSGTHSFDFAQSVSIPDHRAIFVGMSKSQRNAEAKRRGKPQKQKRGA
jgi:hypothetical protein